MKKLWILGFIVAVVAVAGASPAVAGCGSPRSALSGGGGPSYFGTYINFNDLAFASTGDKDGNGVFIARFWQTGAPGVSYEGACTAANCGPGSPPGPWVRGFAGFPGFESFYINLADGNIVGCPFVPEPGAPNNLTVYLENQNSDTFIMFTAPQNTGAFPDYDYRGNIGTGTTHVASSKLPQVISSSRAGSTVNVTYNVPDPQPSVSALGAGSFPGAVTNVQVFTCASAIRPGLDVATGCAGPWTAGAVLGASGGQTTVGVDCTNEAVQQWVAHGFEIDGQSPFFVGEPVEVECDPTLADPGNRQKIQRPGQGTQRPKRRQ